MFRLLLTGPTTSTSHPHNFALSHVEFYGYLYRSTPTRSEPATAAAEATEPTASGLLASAAAEVVGGSSCTAMGGGGSCVQPEGAAAVGSCTA